MNARYSLVLSLIFRRTRWIIVLLILLCPGVVTAQELTLEEFYERFNMRTIFSSFGQNLKHYCESYPKEFLLKKKLIFLSKKTLELGFYNDYLVWSVTIIGKNRIQLYDYIPSGTYRSTEDYEVFFDQEHQDWRTKITYIPIPQNCEKYDIHGPK